MVSAKTAKILWGAAASVCSFSLCNKKLINAGSPTGQICHIIAKNLRGPRGKHTISDIDGIDNLILLCPEHHKIIDDNPDQYTVEVLQTYKREHENNISNKVRSSPCMAINYIKEFERRQRNIGFNWLKTLPQADRALHKKEYEQLLELIEWINTRDWAACQHKNLEDSFRILEKNISKTIDRFDNYLKDEGDYKVTEKFYKTWCKDLVSEERSKLEGLYDDHVCGLMDDTVNVARSLNKVLRVIRKDFDPNFLGKEGIVRSLHGKAV